jgi:DNA-binding LacI/PurR family transcriptional regulator
LNTSYFTVQLALRKLENQGYVIRKHGAGTYVADPEKAPTLSQATLFCLPQSGHLFGDFTQQLTGQVAEMGYIPIALDMDWRNSKTRIPRLIEEIARTEIKFFIFNGSAHFPFSVLDLPSFKEKNKISIFEYAGGNKYSDIHKILIDFKQGGEMVAEYFYEKGHRKVAIVSRGGSIPSILNQKVPKNAESRFHSGHPGAYFARKWEKLGGEWELVVSDRLNDPEIKLDGQKFNKIFTNKTPPTAIFGTSDIEAFLAQNIIQRDFQHLMPKLEIMGYGNTPWTCMASPQINTVDMGFQKIMEHCCELMAIIDSGYSSKPFYKKIKQNLIIR